MLNAQKNLSTGFLILLSLPTAAIGFCLSSAVATTTWLLSTRYGLHLENIALIWLMGPLMGLLVQPIVGAISDRTWLWNGRRRPFLLAGGVAGAISTFAMLELDAIAAATGVSLLVVAVVVVLVSDLSTNVTFNPARSLVADLTPEGEHRVRGYAWMQVVSGVLGISAYLISIFLGNEILVLTTVAVTFFLTVVPAFFIEERAPPERPERGQRVHAVDGKGIAAFRALLPMSGFAFYGVFIAVDKLVLDNALADLAMPLFIAVVAATVVRGAWIVRQGRSRPSEQGRLRVILMAHGFAWLGVQSMFVMTFFYIRDFVVPNAAGSVLADVLYGLTNSAASTAADTAGRILSMGFLLMNVVGAALPVLVLKPLCARWGKVAVHRAAMGAMAGAYLFTALGTQNEIFYYLGMLLCGIGWSSLISIVFAIFSESVDASEMGVSMGVFNSSLVLPALAVPGLLKLSAALDEHRGMFLLFALSLAISFAFWCAVSERASPSGSEARGAR
jgi:Na+/melibiose symporter-like transporter